MADLLGETAVHIGSITDLVEDMHTEIIHRLDAPSAFAFGTTSRAFLGPLKRVLRSKYHKDWTKLVTDIWYDLGKYAYFELSVHFLDTLKPTSIGGVATILQGALAHCQNDFIVKLWYPLNYVDKYIATTAGSSDTYRGRLEATDPHFALWISLDDLAQFVGVGGSFDLFHHFFAAIMKMHRGQFDPTPGIPNIAATALGIGAARGRQWLLFEKFVKNTKVPNDIIASNAFIRGALCEFFGCADFTSVDRLVKEGYASFNRQRPTVTIGDGTIGNARYHDLVEDSVRTLKADFTKNNTPALKQRELLGERYVSCLKYYDSKGVDWARNMVIPITATIFRTESSAFLNYCLENSIVHAAVMRPASVQEYIFAGDILMKEPLDDNVVSFCAGLIKLGSKAVDAIRRAIESALGMVLNMDELCRFCLFYQLLDDNPSALSNFIPKKVDGDDTTEFHLTYEENSELLIECLVGETMPHVSKVLDSLRKIADETLVIAYLDEYVSLYSTVSSDVIASILRFPIKFITQLLARFEDFSMTFTEDFPSEFSLFMIQSKFDSQFEDFSRVLEFLLMKEFKFTRANREMLLNRVDSSMIPWLVEHKVIEKTDSWVYSRLAADGLFGNDSNALIEDKNVLHILPLKEIFAKFDALFSSGVSFKENTISSFLCFADDSSAFGQGVSVRNIVDVIAKLRGLDCPWSQEAFQSAIEMYCSDEEFAPLVNYFVGEKCPFDVDSVLDNMVQIFSDEENTRALHCVEFLVKELAIDSERAKSTKILLGIDHSEKDLSKNNDELDEYGNIGDDFYDFEANSDESFGEEDD